MGIKDLNKLLKVHVPDAYYILDPEELNGKIISIDANAVVWKNAAIVNKSLVTELKDPCSDEISQTDFTNQVVKKLVHLEHQIIRRGASSIWCWDGASLPEKTDEVAKRTGARKKLKETIEIKKKLCEGLDEFDQITIKNEIRAKMMNDIQLNYESFLEIRETMIKIGFTHQISPGEGETLAASYTMHGFSDYTYSVDSDVLAIGSKRIITNWTYKQIDGINLNLILETLELTQSEFRDLSILLGCDFNLKLKGVGPENTLKLIKRIFTIDKLTDIEQEPLKHDRCRELLSPYKDFPEPIMTEHNFELLQKYVSMRKTIDEIVNANFQRIPVKESFTSNVKYEK